MPTKNPTRQRAAVRPAVKTTLSLPADTSDALRELAADRNTTLAEVIRRAVRLEQFLDQAQKSGGKVLVKDADDTIKELVIF
jgi:Ribbon-helix-helix protein, copG family